MKTFEGVFVFFLQKCRFSALETNVLCHLLRPDVDPCAHHVIGSKDLPRDKDKMKTFVGSFIPFCSPATI